METKFKMQKAKLKNIKFLYFEFLNFNFELEFVCV